MILRVCSLGLFLIVLSGCARSSVAVNQAALSEGDGKAAPPTAAKAAPDGEPFRFPDDHGGKLLGQLLSPTAQPPAEMKTAPGPRPLPPPDAVASPELPLTPNQAGLPRPLLTPPAPKLKPHAPPEETPLSSYRGEPTGPTAQHLPAGARVHVASVDVELPVALPILARPDVDRVSLDDPTSDDSLRAALAEVPPVRSTPIPFQRRTLPDPFENAQTVRLKTPPPEDGTPAHTAPQPPK